MKSTPRLALVGPTPDRHGGPGALAMRLRPRAEKVGAATLDKGDAGSRDVAGPAPGVDVDKDFVITCITAQSALPQWMGAWRRLLAESLSPEKIYQTPEFFRFLVDTRSAGADQFELFLITHRLQDQVAGIVPVRISSIALDVGLTAWQPRLVRILGSVPLMPADAALMQHLCAHLLRAFPDCAAVSMQAFPVEMQAQLQCDRRHRTLVLHGWRDCHTIPLPDAWPAYTARLGAKKRYNLTRQYRLLEQAAGPLQLERIDRSCAVKLLSEGVRALAPQGDPAHKAAHDYRVLAANRLLLSYVLRSADDIIAVIVGSRYGDTWHVYQILYAPAYHHLSAGTVALHTALQDVITHFAFTSADLGFGSPRERFASTHALKTRAHVLIARRASWRAHLLDAFIRFDRARTVCASRIKPLLRRIARN